MPTLIAIVTLLAALATWWFRLKRIGTAARDVGRMAGRVKNAPRKFAFMRRAATLGLKAVNDPREAAAILMVLVAGGYGERPIGARQETAILAELRSGLDLSVEHADDLLTHARWMLRDVDVPTGVAARMARVVLEAPAIRAKELVDLDTMLIAVSEAEGLPSEQQLRLLQVYRDKAGLRA